MKRLTQKELNEILRLHALWLKGEPEGVKAVLSDANLSGADLSGADLSGADLSYADLSYADLSGADLSGADLSYADLSYADLSGADLSYADLSYADLSYADLSGANLSDANLCDADLSGTKLPDTSIAPESGSFYGFKKLSNGVIVKVKIPSNAKRLNAITSRKCRASELKIVEEVSNPKGVVFNKDNPIKSTNYGDAVYFVGAHIKEPDFDDDIREECAKGLHFFLTLNEASEWI